MLTGKTLQKLVQQHRTIEVAEQGDRDLGPLMLLPGKWSNLPGLPGRGWNMIALPFAKGKFGYRLLVNQYNETLDFELVDKSVPNRGIKGKVETDQFLATLDYKQKIAQIAADDSPKSGDAGPPGLAIHLEPGLWIHMANEITNGIDIGRLATIPHGNALLGLGTHKKWTKKNKKTKTNVKPGIPDVNGLPIGVPHDLNTPYLAPYKHYHENLFEGLFDPVNPNALIKSANNDRNIKRITTLEVDTTVESGGISNIPFIVRQANTSSMKSTFWIQELSTKNANGKPKLRLVYSQIVMLSFFDRIDGLPGLIHWPHVSINVMEKVPE